MNKREMLCTSDPVIAAYKKDVDRTLIRENLRLSVDERFVKLARLQEFAEELREIDLSCHESGKGEEA